MAFGTKESSRNQSNLTKLFLFRGADPSAESLIRSITVGPGDGEFAYGTTVVTDTTSVRTLNDQAGGGGRSDFVKSIDQLVATVPGITNVTLIVSWQATDLRAGACQVRPRAETSDLTTAPYSWQVGSVTRGSAQLVSQHDGSPAYAGAPSDRAVFEAIRNIRTRGIRVTLMPVLQMDIPTANGLTDPYGGSQQDPYPWVGRLTVNPAPGEPNSANMTAAARSQIEAFFGATSEQAFAWNDAEKRVEWQPGWLVEDVWNYRKFVLHMATIAAAADANDFLLGSDLLGLTNVRDQNGAFPAVDALVSLAFGCRQILGASRRISYAAHWTEYGPIRVGADLIFNMDKLWADPNINFVGINNYTPISDWRDGFTHADWKAGFSSGHDIDYLRANIEGGEGYDWSYASTGARTSQNREPITDATHDEPWVFRLKDFRNWWANPHHSRIGGVRQPTKSEWNAASKPIIFTQMGCPAINKGTNWPGNFKNSRINQPVPFFSNGRPDAAIMRAAIEAQIRHWTETNLPGFLELARLTVFTWDARPYPSFPQAGGWDASNWRTGPWLTGRMSPGRAFDGGTFGPYAFTDAEFPITRNGITYEPWPIKHSDITVQSDDDKQDLTVTMATGTELEGQFLAYPPSQVVNLTIFQGQMDDEPTLVDYPALWLGRVSAPDWSGREVAFTCVPVSSSISRPGLRRNYQRGCPHVLYGDQCRARKRAASSSAIVNSLNRSQVIMTAPITDHAKFLGGLMEWTLPGGRREVRSIIATAQSSVRIRGTTVGLAAGVDVTIAWGCNHTLGERGCLMHDNVLNYGGQDMIPRDNPLSQKNQFY